MALPLSDGDVAAIIDLGSNSARLLIARKLGPFGFEVVDEERFDARLAEGQEDGLLTAIAMQRCLLALRVMLEIASAYHPASTLVVGTEAIRRAVNSPTLLAAALHECGVDVRILSGEEEAAAAFLGVINAMDRTEGVVLDLGGGSLEMMQFQSRRLVSAASSPLGAIYARERILHSDPPSKSEIRNLRKAVRLAVGKMPNAEVVIGTGGAIRNLARIVRLERRYPFRYIHGLEVSRRDVRRLGRRLSQISTHRRRNYSGVNPARADTLHAAAIVVDEVMDLLGADSLVISGRGLREGLMWQMVRPSEPVVDDVRHASILRLAVANGVDLSGAEPSLRTASAIFEVLAPLHGLSEQDRDLLQSAVRLSTIGLHIGYYDRDRHAEYMVLNGSLDGFSHREIVFLATLVRCSDSGTPSFAQYRPLMRPDDAHRCVMLASILGVVRAVHRRPVSPFHEVRAAVDHRSLVLTVRADGPVEAELEVLERQKKRFSSVFDRMLQVEVEPTVA